MLFEGAQKLAKNHSIQQKQNIRKKSWVPGNSGKTGNSWKKGHPENSGVPLNHGKIPLQITKHPKKSAVLRNSGFPRYPTRSRHSKIWCAWEFRLSCYLVKTGQSKKSRMPRMYDFWSHPEKLDIRKYRPLVRSHRPLVRNCINALIRSHINDHLRSPY